MLPTRFWLTAGKGESENSELEAIDAAFMDAGIGFQNHVAVSSIPPLKEIKPQINNGKGITYIPVDNELKLLPLSSVIHVVRSLNIGVKSDDIACSIALAKIKIEVDGRLDESILAFEAQGSSITEAEESALTGVRKMMEFRSGKIQENWGESGYKLISSTLRIESKFGCVVAFVVFDPFTYKKM